jgi:tRNA A-37 threonylcarbamoyl transferase component Bud32
MRLFKRITESLLSDGEWCYSRRLRPDDPTQGWKLHVSATVISAPKVFAQVYPILRRQDVLFKVPRRLDLLMFLNSGLPHFSQIGKFLTIYPGSTAEALELARKLHAATRRLHGPEIPFDQRYRKDSLVHYRYGSFGKAKNGAAGPRSIIDPAGRSHPDRRAPDHAVPRWLDDPFQKSRPKSNRASTKSLLGSSYIRLKLIAQRGKGGVHEAVDLSVLPARLVIIKEGRRHGETAWDGQDGYARVKQEGRVLRALRNAGVPVPEVLHEFTQDGNRYLVLEKTPGRPLLPRNRVQPAKISWQRAAKILNRLGSLLHAIHSVGYVWRDCKPEHIFVSRGVISLIDFEGACRITDTDVFPWGSHYYLPPVYRREFAGRQPSTLEDDYALGVIVFQFLSGRFPPASARTCSRIYKGAHCPDHLRLEIENLLDSGSSEMATVFSSRIKQRTVRGLR